LAALLCVAGLLTAATVRAQSSCSSDGQAAPTRLLERFINADCQACWPAPGETPPADALVLDWITPGSQGEAAPLSAAALRDSLWRLQALGQPVPARSAKWALPVATIPGLQLRVAHGLPLNGYLGASITLALSASLAAQAQREGWQAWLVVVETIAAGTEGTPAERHLVRNSLQPDWNWAGPTGTGTWQFSETRPMSLPEGTQAQRLGVVGWVQDSRGHVLAAARSQCTPQEE
jgi:hypothetical protein